MGDRVSVIIRTKDEQHWMGACLEAVFQQDYPDLEVVVVDNESGDRTLDIVSSYDCRVVRISDDEFNFARALNRGIAASSGELVACLSGHCIPVNEQWMLRLAAPFQNEQVAAVYGRQEPLPDSSPFDKRDLWTTFGLDRRVQLKDFFFHNANSMIRRTVWEQLPFCEGISGVEDRDWAKKVLAMNLVIMYEPTASVYHHHGIHHDQSRERAARVVNVIELIQRDLT